MVNATTAPRSETQFEAFAGRAYLELLRFGVLLVNDRHMAEDLVQTALIKVCTRWARIEREGAALAYTRTVMVRQANRWRRRRWTAELTTDPNRLPLLGPDGYSDDSGHVEAVRDALRALPVGQRSVLVLRYYADQSEAEIAKTLRISRGTVKSRAARGLLALRMSGLRTGVAALEVEEAR